jgi:predicted phosphodiesterase
MRKASILLATILLSLSVTAQTDFHLYFIGDGGKLDGIQPSYKKFLQQQLSNDKSPSAIIFLGDNIYPKGLPENGNQQRKKAENVLQAHLDLVEGFKGEIIFVPGNHDWKRGTREGLQFVLNQQAWVDSLHNKKVKLLPGNGCPGPIEIPLHDKLVLIVIDSQWWLHPWDKPTGETSACDCKTPAEFTVQLDDMLRRNQHKRVVVAAHHPVITYGEHGGIFSAKDHIFPFTDLNKNLYIPLPIVGSLYPMYRKIFGNIQDQAHPQYRQFSEGVISLLEQYPGVVYASGHDHSLQYSLKDSIHYVVSGAGSKVSHAKKKGYAQYAESQLGYARVSINKTGGDKLEYITNDQISFEKNIGTIKLAKKDSAAQVLFEKGTTEAQASTKYHASKSREKWLGENYREEWETKIDVPVFDIGKERGGLEILQRGGGNQTLSLRLEDSTGREYTLRSIEKFPERALPEPLRNTFAKDFVQDQISASHPYAALVVPHLAKPAGIYHSNPKVVFVPNDPRFDMYQKDFSNQLMLFEERAGGSGKGLEFFGNAEKMINTTKLLEQLGKDNDNMVDEKFFLRSRLFDMWIGDWDRHDDQWRWAEFETKKGNVYKPIPRDRDQAFFINEGRIPKILSKPFLLFQFEGFNEEIRNPSGLMFSGRYIDRKFLTTLTREQWMQVADDLCARLTDEAIESAIKQWPEEIYKLHGEEVIKKLKARRSTLTSDALKHYLFLSQEVSLVGSDKRELFEVERKDNGNVNVAVYKLNKEGEKGKLISEREFIRDETQEIRLYGLAGDDRFVITGKKNKIKVRVIGGSGNDEVTAKHDKRVLVYDLKNEVTLSPEAKVKNRTSREANVNEYNWKDFKYGRTAPLVFGTYNVDDGVFLGGGLLAIRHGFRKEPFKSQHILLGSYAINTSSFNFRYDGKFTRLIGKWDLDISADAKSPNYVNNFFGWGNESQFDKNIDDEPGINVDDPIDYYRVRFREIVVEPKISRKFGQAGFLKLGGSFQWIEIEDPEGEDRYISEYNDALPNPVIEKSKNYSGVTYSWGFDKRNNSKFTTRGIYFEQTSRFMKGISSPDFSSNNVSLALYQSFKFPAIVTFAVRAGGGINTGSYEFYQAQVLDGKSEIRGFRKTRFYGDRKMYVNNEVRIRLGSIQSYLFPAHVGILGFYDVGRVWYEDSTGNDPTASSGKSSTWHKGFGGGLWLTPFNLAAVTAEVGHSKEGTLFYVRLGFLF